jgi:hypothetical protein
MKQLIQKGICFFMLFLLFRGVPGLSALPAQKIVYPGEWVYDALSILSREQKIVSFADSALTIAQLERILDEIDEETLSESGKLLYERIDAYLHSSPWFTRESDALSVGIDLALQPELYFKTNSETTWIYDYHSRNPLFLAPISLSLGPYITAEMDVFVSQNEYAATQSDNYINIPVDPVSQFDIHIPKRAYLSAGLPLGEASGVHFAIGLGEDFLGRTRTGSIILSDYMERVSYAQLSLYSPMVKYTAEVKQLEVNKYQYMHYLHIRPYKTVSLTLNEGVMVNAPLELRFLNPMTVFHSHESYKTYTDYNEDLGHVDDGTDHVYDQSGGSRIGSFFGAKIELQPWKNIRLYGLFAMDQLQLGIEKDHWEDSLTPDALAFQAGAEVSIPVPRGYWIFGLEGVYTYPYMYVLWDKKWSFYKELQEVDNATIRYWTGTPFGPDSIAGTLWVGYADSRQWSLTLSFLLSAQGVRSDKDIFDDPGDPYGTPPDFSYRPNHGVYHVITPPTGTPIYTYTASLLWNWAPKDWLSLSLQPGYRIIRNLDHIPGKTEHGFEIALSARVQPPVALKH